MKVVDTTKYRTIEEHKKALNNKYEKYLRYPIQKMRVRKWYEAGPGTGHGKGIKYDITYHTQIKNYSNNLGLYINAKSLDELEKKIKVEIKRRKVK